MPSNYPETRRELLRAGYKFLNNSKCKSCDAPIEWWKTTNGKLLPFNPMADDNALAKKHTCPDANRTVPLPAATPVPAAIGDLKTIEERVNSLRRATNARVIVLLTEDGGEVTAWRTGLRGEDLRNDLITVANNVRNEIVKGGF